VTSTVPPPGPPRLLLPSCTPSTLSIHNPLISQLHPHRRGCHLRSTTKTIFEKKGRGIYRRFFHFVPASGTGSVNRRIPTSETLDGSSKLHVFAGEPLQPALIVMCRPQAHNASADQGARGKLGTRQLSCYTCSNCSKFLSPTDCKNVAGLGGLKEEELSLKSPAPVPQTRGALAKAGLELSMKCRAGMVGVIL
jgi:hypothetical protein